MRTDSRPGIDLTTAVLAAVLLAVCAWSALPKWTAPGPFSDLAAWRDLAEMRHSEMMRETAIEFIRAHWLTMLISPGYRLDLLILAMATLLAIRVWWRLPPSATRLRRMAPALVPVLIVASLVTLELHRIGVGVAALKPQGLVHPGAIGTGIGELVIYLGWSLFAAATCSIVFAVRRPSGPLRLPAAVSTTGRA